MKQIVVNINEFEIKVAVLEDDELVEFFVERESKERMVGNIYKGKIANVLPGMESAFVNIGLPKNAFLYVKDLREFEEKYLDGIKNSNKPIEDILNVGDDVVVQILKEPKDTKGARVTTHYTIPGKYLVLMPNNDYIAISKKITDEKERQRLYKILEDMKPKGIGVIIRTAGKDKDESIFTREIEYLIKQWKEVEYKISKAKVGDVVYRDINIIERSFRDVFTSDVDYLVINSEEKYWDLIDYITAFSETDLKMKIKLYQGEKAIFDYYNINKSLEIALGKKVWLKCGGYLIIEKTEALVSIDVNTGKNTGVSNLESTVVETNIEAAEEIPKQLRLRNLSGIIIIDFIDMKYEEDKQKVLDVLEKNIEKDRIKCNIVKFSELGLVEMTRKRVGKELSNYFMDTCPYCKGSGKIKAPETVIHDMIEEIKEVSEDLDIRKIKIKLNKEVYEKYMETYSEFIEGYINKKGKVVEVYFDEDFHKERSEIILEK